MYFVDIMDDTQIPILFLDLTEPESLRGDSTAYDWHDIQMMLNVWEGNEDLRTLFPYISGDKWAARLKSSDRKKPVPCAAKLPTNLDPRVPWTSCHMTFSAAYN